MASYTVHYRFSKSFGFPAEDVYRWCTNYKAEDVALMGEKGKRMVTRINEETLILTDTILEGDKKVTRKRLVRLFPERLFWTNTRLSEDGKYSQFLYQIFPDRDGGSRLDFIGSHVFYDKERPKPEEIASMAEELAMKDSKVWELLAEAMEKDFLRDHE